MSIPRKASSVDGQCRRADDGAHVENAKVPQLPDGPENIALQQKYTGYQSASPDRTSTFSRILASCPEFNPPADLKISFAVMRRKAIRAYDRI